MASKSAHPPGLIPHWVNCRFICRSWVTACSFKMGCCSRNRAESRCTISRVCRSDRDRMLVSSTLAISLSSTYNLAAFWSGWRDFAAAIAGNATAYNDRNPLSTSPRTPRIPYRTYSFSPCVLGVRDAISASSCSRNGAAISAAAARTALPFIADAAGCSKNPQQK